ncbi:hypothetical protein SISNIDRAFT_454630 [Sistotremastrum niveocremeum HHB9708]|uniref:CENP-V/GFA domain-containing protein n=2 Tax=Sistotremastraceae TaxID=3402574 RepID=A0A164UPZ9_9AGAM|nr:hypothetical protein SISNIDRAFT_454630 [Sistotremastrum niveocremeum HHB9708]KZT43757.1 hypothetical protein SISSUDRAFT_1039637 [Sistotremastrum suecicum HHB10207 ss-3]
MPVTLSGSCHCGAVKFTVDSSTPVPYQLCCCSICRKVGGYVGAVNLGAHSDTLKIQGKEHISVYKAIMNRGEKDEHEANSERNFCSKCSAMLWLYDSEWPELLHPFASAIDSPELEAPGEMVCLMTASKPSYFRLPEGKKVVVEEYPELSLADWHKKHGKYVK